MAIINFARREIIARIVYCGARGAGTTASVRKLYLAHTPDIAGGLLPFGPSGSSEMSQIFEYMPSGENVPGFTLRIRLYSLPGALDNLGHRAEVLRDVDGIVFVANARNDQADANLEALLDLDRHLKKSGQDLATLPMVFQINHTDSADALPLDDVAFDLNPYQHPVVIGSPVDGSGLVEVRDLIADRIAALLRDNLEGRPTSLQVHAIHRSEAATVEQVVEAHQRAVRLSEAQATPAPVQRAAPWSRSGYDVLPMGLSVDVPYQPSDLLGMQPLQVLGTRIHGGKVVLDLVLGDHEGQNPTRLTVNLAPPQDSATPSSAVVAYSHQPTMETSPFDPSITQPLAPPGDTWRSVGYGLLATVAGTIIGLLVGFLIWA